MTPLETVNKMLDFTAHIKKVQNAINNNKELEDKEGFIYWSEVLKELLKVRHNVEIKIAKERLNK